MLLVSISAVISIFFDFGLIVHLYFYGYPKYVDISDGRFTVHRIPLTGADWLILLTISCLHIGLFYLAWKWWQPYDSRKKIPT